MQLTALLYAIAVLIITVNLFVNVLLIFHLKITCYGSFRVFAFEKKWKKNSP